MKMIPTLARWLSILAAAVPAMCQPPNGTPNGPEVYRRACATCHEQTNIDRMPQRAVLARMSPENVLAALSSGVMQAQGAGLSVAERRAVAEFVTAKTFGGESSTMAKDPSCKAAGIAVGDFSDPLRGSVWNGWGVDTTNTRFQPNPGFSASDVPKLKLKWAYALPGAVSISTQPVVAGGRVMLGGRTVVALDAKSGCTIWEFKTDAPVRAAVTIAKPDGTDRWIAFVGDGSANVYALDAATGEMKWKTKSDNTPVSRITGAPKFYNNRLFVPISSLEDGPSANASYECCKFSGAMVSLDAVTGKILWTTRTVSEPNHLVGQTKEGHNLWGPSGASIWDSPTIDPKRNAVYAGTGNNHSNPPTATSDSMFSFNMETGKVLWVTQMTKGGDAWNIGCGSRNANCPENAGPDHDIGNSPILVELKNGKRALVFGQKSGEVHAVDPDDNGKLLWSHRIGHGGSLGGVEWGATSDGQTYYVPLSDVKMGGGRGGRSTDPGEGGGLFAFDIATGNQLWKTTPDPCPPGREHCSPAQSQAASSMPGIVFSGSVDGFMRAFSAKDGRVVWSFDTIRDYTTVNGVKGRGGSLDTGGPAIAAGMLFVPSGYSSWGGSPGNVMLVFSVDGK
jgi:polyvinyl alcohol dehydrogenase (cytochrome)